MKKYVFKNPIPRIAVAFNLKKEPPANMPEDYYAEYDNLAVPTAIKNALEKKGFIAELVEANEDFFEKIKYGNYDFVFNIAEGLNGGSRESQVPAILDMLGIPYTGSSVFTQALTLDKRRTKEILQYYNVPTPKFQIFSHWNQKLNPELSFPLFVKPNGEGSSKGIRNESLVKNEEELRKQLKFVINNYHQEALVEEYLDGREFTVAILGNNPPKVLPIVEVTFDYLPEHVNKFDSYEVKWIWDNPNNPVDPVVCPAKISKELERMIKAVSLKTFKVLGCVDLARLDIRLDKNGIPNVLELNALPGLMPDPLENSRFPKACFTAGMSYDDIIINILFEAFKRYGLLKELNAELKNNSGLKL
ncbi:MAG: D-alanine--D-alanine ligase [Candidatus Woesearchaeota archaeon]